MKPKCLKIIIIIIIIIIAIENVNDIAVEKRNIQNAIYDYFAKNNGTVGGESDDLKQQYGELSTRQLKHELCNLKIQNDPIINEQYGMSQNSFDQKILRNRLKSEIMTQR